MGLCEGARGKHEFPTISRPPPKGHKTEKNGRTPRSNDPATIGQEAAKRILMITTTSMPKRPRLATRIALPRQRAPANVQRSGGAQARRAPERHGGNAHAMRQWVAAHNAPTVSSVSYHGIDLFKCLPTKFVVRGSSVEGF